MKNNPHQGSTLQSLFEETGEWEEVKALAEKKKSMTTWKQFADEIEKEAHQEGQSALDELEAFKQYFGKQRTECEKDLDKQPCLMDKFFEHQKTLPPSMRSAGALISCPCRKCNPARL